MPDERPGEEQISPQEAKRNKAQEIRDLAASGHTIRQIMAVVGVSYQHVYNTLTYSKDLKNEEEALKAARAKVGTRQLRVPPVEPPTGSNAPVRDRIRDHQESGKLEEMQRKLIDSDFDGDTISKMLEAAAAKLQPPKKGRKP